MLDFAAGSSNGATMKVQYLRRYFEVSPAAWTTIRSRADAHRVAVRARATAIACCVAFGLAALLSLGVFAAALTRRAPASDEHARIGLLVAGSCSAANLICATAFGCLAYRLRAFEDYLMRKAGLQDDETRCSRCGYLLKGLSVGRCPECGTQNEFQPGGSR